MIRFYKFKVFYFFFLSLLIMFTMYSNCSEVDFEKPPVTQNENVDPVDDNPDENNPDVDPVDDNPDVDPKNCNLETMIHSYQALVTRHTTTNREIAKQCLNDFHKDFFGSCSFDLEESPYLYIGLNNGCTASTRFTELRRLEYANGCGKEFCQHHIPGSTGIVIESEAFSIYNDFPALSETLDGEATVECYQQVPDESANDPCKSVLDERPLFEKFIVPSPEFINFCGGHSFWDLTLFDCADNWCQNQEGQDFKTGQRVAYNETGQTIVCFRHPKSFFED